MTQPTHPVPPAVRLLAAVAAAALAAGALTGCSAHPGKAFVGTYTGVDGKTHAVSVSEEDVQTAASELSKVPNMDANRIMNLLVSGQFLEGVAGKHGVAVTDRDALAALAEVGGPGGYSRASIDVVRSALIGQHLKSLDEDQQAAFVAEADAVQASLAGDASPRYTIGQQAWRVPASDSPLSGVSRPS